MNFQGIIGNTPMVKIAYKFDGETRFTYAKLESYNLSGSIKDRIAAHIVQKGEESGLLKAGQPIVEMTSGNTGIAFSAIGALTNHPVHIFMPDWASEERKKIMSFYGATLHLVSKEEGGFTAALENAKKLAKEIGAFEPRQFDNQENPMAHYLGTAPEILAKLPDVTDFVSGVGSGGTIMGMAKRLKKDHDVKITAIEPDTMPLLTKGIAIAAHRIEGIGDDFIPSIVDRSYIDRVYDLFDGDAIVMASRLAKELGLAVGISSGANFLGAALVGGKNKKVATVFSDDNKKYLTTDLANPPKETSDMISSRIELLYYEVV